MMVGRFRLGMRTLKQQLLSCCVFFYFNFPSWLTYDCLFSSCFSLRQDLNTSLSFGKSRIIETHWVAFSFALCISTRLFSNQHLVELLLLPLLVIIVIVVSDGINNNAGIISATATLFNDFFKYSKSDSFQYAMERVLDTFIGTFIAIGLNVFYNLSQQKKPMKFLKI